MARRTVRDREVLHKLFHDVGPRYQGRPGGYTRIIKVGYRHGDAAPLSYVELLPSEPAEEAAPPEEKGKAKGKKGAAAEAKTEAQPQKGAKGGTAKAEKAQTTKVKKKPKKDQG
jgi:large subunit ribosomal protein L17